MFSEELGKFRQVKIDREIKRGVRDLLPVFPLPKKAITHRDIRPCSKQLTDHPEVFLPHRHVQRRPAIVALRVQIRATLN